MSRDQSPSDFQIEFDSGGLFARRRAEVLPDGSYLFEDDLNIGGLVTTTIITCAAWLLELYELGSGEVFFASGREEIRPHSKRFGVLYPPFSITQVSMRDLNSPLLGVASDVALPEEFRRTPIVFETEGQITQTNSLRYGKEEQTQTSSLRYDASKAPGSGDEAVAILAAGRDRQSIEFNPEAGRLSREAKQLIDDNYLAHPSIARIAKRLGVSHPHLSRQFKSDFGMTPSDYLRKLRVADAPLRLARGEQIIEVSEDVGYNDLSRFYKQFRKTTNTSPGACKTMLRSRR